MSSKKSAVREHKEQLYKLFARVGNALANPHRLELIDLLVQSPRTVEELAGLAQMSIANTSQHLQRLKKVRLVSDQKNGLYVKYRLADPEVARLWVELRRVAEMQFEEVGQELELYRSHRSDIEKISIEQLQDGLRRNEVILVDARPEVEFLAGHLPGAVSYPVDTICYRIDEFPLGKTLVTYCRGPYCIDADEALILLSAYGYPVKRLEEGVFEWQEAGYRVEGVG